MTQGGICRQRMTLMSQEAEPLEGFALVGQCSSGHGEIGVVTTSQGSAASPRIPAHRGLGAPGGLCPRDSRCRNAVAMLGPQEPPRLAAWCSESMGSITGPMMSMRAAPQFLRKGNGQLERALTCQGVCPFFFWKSKR